MDRAILTNRGAEGHRSSSTILEIKLLLKLFEMSLHTCPVTKKLVARES
jgi:hypothetical protein